MDWDYINADDTWPVRGTRIGDKPLYEQTFIQGPSMFNPTFKNSPENTKGGGSRFRNV